VLYVGSFSKTTLSALRLGFIITPPSLRAALHAAKYLADWHSPLPLQAAMADFISEGSFARHLRRMRRDYEARRSLIATVLARDFGDEFEAVSSSAGLHLSALARRASVEEIDRVVGRASSLGMECLPLAMFGMGPMRPAGLVLGYGAIGADRIEEGLRRLRLAADGALATARPPVTRRRAARLGRSARSMGGHPSRSESG
jgi:GntR family transcriptional regulator/MocR family aminotransferase